MLAKQRNGLNEKLMHFCNLKNFVRVHHWTPRNRSMLCILHRLFKKLFTHGLRSGLLGKIPRLSQIFSLFSFALRGWILPCSMSQFCLPTSFFEDAKKWLVRLLGLMIGMPPSSSISHQRGGKPWRNFGALYFRQVTFHRDGKKQRWFSFPNRMGAPGLCVWRLHYGGLVRRVWQKA